MAETEMVEMVAEAIRDNIEAALPKGVSVDYRYAARAAIESMREPSDALIEAGKVLAVETPPHDKTGDVTAWHVWTAMIDAALSPPSKD